MPLEDNLSTQPNMTGQPVAEHELPAAGGEHALPAAEPGTVPPPGQTEQQPPMPGVEAPHVAAESPLGPPGYAGEDEPGPQANQAADFMGQQTPVEPTPIAVTDAETGSTLGSATEVPELSDQPPSFVEKRNESRAAESERLRQEAYDHLDKAKEKFKQADELDSRAAGTASALAGEPEH